MLCVGSTSSLTGREYDEGKAKQLERGGNKGRTVWALAVLLGCRNRPFVGTHVSPISALRPSGMDPLSRLMIRLRLLLHRDSPCIVWKN